MNCFWYKIDELKIWMRARYSELKNELVVLDDEKDRIQLLHDERAKNFLEQTKLEKQIIDLTEELYPPKVFFDLTYRCNLHCLHCHNKYPDNSEPSLEFIKDVLDQLSKVNTMLVSFSGGEPFIRKDIFDILDYVESKDMMFTVPTNSTLLNESKIERLNHYNNLIYVEVSVDGNEETHNKQRRANCYDKVFSTLKLLKKYDIPVKIITVATNITYPAIFNMKSFVDEYSKFWKIIKYIPELKNEDLILSEDKLKEIVDFGNKEEVTLMCFNELSTICLAGRMTASIYANGDVSVCGLMPQFKCGNLYDRKYADIINEGWSFRLFRNLSFFGGCPAIEMYSPTKKSHLICDKDISYK